MVILLIFTTFQLLSIDTTDIFKNIVYYQHNFWEYENFIQKSYEKLTILNVYQQWTSTEFS